MPNTMQPIQNILAAALVWIAAGVLLLTIGRAVTTREDAPPGVDPTPAATATVGVQPRTDDISCPDSLEPC